MRRLHRRRDELRDVALGVLLPLAPLRDLLVADAGGLLGGLPRNPARTGAGFRWPAIGLNSLVPPGDELELFGDLAGDGALDGGPVAQANFSGSASAASMTLRASRYLVSPSPTASAVCSTAGRHDWRESRCSSTSSPRCFARTRFIASDFRCREVAASCSSIIRPMATASLGVKSLRMVFSSRSC